ncbi:hypothetical protein EH223_00185 [candidate division KSB1 bacterium]|nr:hypothetical protein [candidate division KSB1 bacterium]RQW07340.1 MAG: hypothetical protein EH223_00185 [candidate division KSB1 bacterium]
MQVVSDDIIQEVLQEQGEMDFLETERLIAQMSREQPSLLTYLMASNEEHYNFEEKQLLLFLGINISQMMKKNQNAIQQVSMEDIETAQEKNIQMFEYLENELPGDFEGTTEMIFKGYNQKNVLRYIIETLFQDDDPHIRPDRKGLIFFDLKTVLDCLDQ